MSKVQMRLVVVDELHQLGQFPAQPRPEAPEQPVKAQLLPVVTVKMVPQEKKDGTEDINEPIWYGQPNGEFMLKFTKPEAMQGLHPGREVIVTIETVDADQ